MKISFVTEYDSRDVTKYSGTAYFMGKALENNSFQVDRVGPLEEFGAHYFKLKQFVYAKLFRKRHLRDREPAILKRYARQLGKILASCDSDLVFCPGTVAISYLECMQPIVFWSDATFAGMLNYYPSFTNLSTKSIINGNEMEQSALRRAKLAIYCTNWAANSAISNYDVDPEKVKVVPWGANIDIRIDRGHVLEDVKSRHSTTCKLLFLGVEWHRKGGDIALAVAEELNSQGLDTQLTVIGCQPPIKRPYPKFLEVVPFIDKSTEEGSTKLISYLAQSHFLILPTRAEASGHAFCEASAFGLPSIAAKTGGVYVEDHINGRLLGQGAAIAEYCEVIWYYFENRGDYETLSMSSFNHFAAHLNWDNSSKIVRELIEGLA